MKFISRLKQNQIFKILSSVKLAVPLLLTLAVTVAFGTIVESRYNADYARLLVYQTDWFYVLLGLLWLNILCATISRIPFKHHHTGFVITHIGLLTLLIGAFVTRIYGIDGLLTIEEGKQARQIVLPELILEVSDLHNNSIRRVPIKKNTSEKGLDYFTKQSSRLPNGLKIKRYVPFAQLKTEYVTAPVGDVALKFGLKSIFFNVQEWLSSKDQPSLSMGPATLSLSTVKNSNPASQESKDIKVNKKSLIADSNTPSLEVLSGVDGKTLFRITLDELKKKQSFELNGVTISLKKIYQQAMVDKKILKEGGQKSKNPALELTLSKGGNKKREVAFAFFPDFSANTEPPFGFRFKYSGLSADAIPSEAANTQSAHGNQISFRYDPSSPESVSVVLEKDGKSVLTKTLTKGEKLFTPWMGIELTLLDLKPSAMKTNTVEAIAPKERSALPPSALLIGSSQSDTQDLWLLEEEPQVTNIDGHDLNLYFGRQSTILPYSVNLLKFTKTNYPGTQTPLSFESQITTDNETEPIKISMNEPLKKGGFTLYQSSFMDLPDGTTASVFSVNQDPGRPIKYAGSVILALGIITFTLMRSPRYKKWRASR